MQTRRRTVKDPELGTPDLSKANHKLGCWQKLKNNVISLKNVIIEKVNSYMPEFIKYQNLKRAAIMMFCIVVFLDNANSDIKQLGYQQNKFGLGGSKKFGVTYRDDKIAAGNEKDQKEKARGKTTKKFYEKQGSVINFVLINSGDSHLNGVSSLLIKNRKRMS